MNKLNELSPTQKSALLSKLVFDIEFTESSDFGDDIQGELTFTYKADRSEKQYRLVRKTDNRNSRPAIDVYDSIHDAQEMTGLWLGIYNDTKMDEELRNWKRQAENFYGGDYLAFGIADKILDMCLSAGIVNTSELR